MIHAGVKKYLCAVYEKPSLILVVCGLKLIHSGIKKYQCDVCNKSFYRPLDLAALKLTHKS